MTESILSYVAMKIGLGIEFLPHDTKEDNRFVNALMGMDKSPEEEAKEALERLERLANNEVLTRVKTETSGSVPFLARVPIEEGGDTGPNYEMLAAKTLQLNVAAGQLLRHVN